MYPLHYIEKKHNNERISAFKIRSTEIKIGCSYRSIVRWI